MRAALALIGFLSLGVGAQAQAPSQAVPPEMQKFAFLVGKWQGKQEFPEPHKPPRAICYEFRFEGGEFVTHIAPPGAADPRPEATWWDAKAQEYRSGSWYDAETRARLKASYRRHVSRPQFRFGENRVEEIHSPSPPRAHRTIYERKSEDQLEITGEETPDSLNVILLSRTVLSRVQEFSPFPAFTAYTDPATLALPERKPSYFDRFTNPGVPGLSFLSGRWRGKLVTQAAGGKSETVEDATLSGRLSGDTVVLQWTIGPPMKPRRFEDVFYFDTIARVPRYVRRVTVSSAPTTVSSDVKIGGDSVIVTTAAQAGEGTLLYTFARLPDRKLTYEVSTRRSSGGVVRSVTATLVPF